MVIKLRKNKAITAFNTADLHAALCRYPDTCSQTRGDGKEGPRAAFTTTLNSNKKALMQLYCYHYILQVSACGLDFIQLN